MSIEKIGKYLNKTITFQEVDDFNQIETDFVSYPSVLLWIGDLYWENKDFNVIINELLKNEVIAICVSGKRVKEQFDLLIKTQSSYHSRKHTMTYIFDEDKIECVLENLFWTVITDDERWDDWGEYHIIVFKDRQNAKYIKNLLHKKWNDNMSDGSKI